MLNKRGQELTLGTIILIVLGVVVLIFLIYGFSTGWGNLWQRVTGIGGGKVNVDTVRTACMLACERGEAGRYAFCTENKTLFFDEKTKHIATCFNITKGKNFTDGDLPNFRIDSCSKIDC